MSFKKNKASRFLAGFLAILIVVSMFPVSAITTFAMPEGVDYTFTVTDANGVLIKDAKVTISVEGKEDQIGITNAEGVAIINFSESVLGTYTVSRLGYENVVGEITADVEPNFNVQMTEIEKRTIIGRVIDENGNAMVGASVKMTGYSTQSTLVSNTGEYTLTVYKGQDYKVMVTAYGYQPVTKNLTYHEIGIIDDIVLVKLKEIADFKFERDADTVKFTTSTLSYKATSQTFPDAKVVYKSSNEAIAKVDADGTISLHGVGDVVISAIAVPDKLPKFLETVTTLNLTVDKGDQENLIWTNTVQDNLTWKDTFTNVLTGGINGTVKYQSSDESIATVDDFGKVTFYKPGTVTITGIMSGGDNYQDANPSYTITVGKAKQEELNFAQKNPDAIFYGDAFTNIATGGSTGKDVIYTSDKPYIASVNETTGEITTHRSGDVKITATIAGNELYEDVSTYYSLTIYKATQKKEFLFTKGASDKEITYGEDFENPAFGGENSPITYKSSDPEIASVDKFTGAITTHKAGTVIITAINPEDERFKFAEIFYKLTVKCDDQEVTFAETNIPTLTWNQSFTNVATAKTNIKYESSDTSVARVDENGKVTFLKAGEVTITATAEATDQYNEAKNQYTIVMNKAQQNVEFELGKNPTTTFNVNNNKYINKSTTNAIKAGERNIKCSYSIVSGSEFVEGEIDKETGAFTIKGAGTIEVKVDYTSNSRYMEGSDSYILTVERAEQTISFPKGSYSKKTGEEFIAPVATELSEKFGTGAITYSVKSDDKGIIQDIDEKTGALILTYKAGTAIIVATKDADANYNKTTAEYILNIDEWTLDSNTEYYKMTGDTVNDSGWFTGNVSVTANKGYVLSYIQTNGNATWENVLTDAVIEDGENNTIAFYVREVETGKISKMVTETIKKDTVVPTASIEVESLTVWDKFLSIISFDNWGKDTSEFTINSDDITSKVDKIEYYVVYNDTKLLDKTALDAVSEWTTYNGAVSIDKDSVYVVYAKVTDVAGNYIYATTNGIVFDGTKPEAKIILPDTYEKTGYHIEDVGVTIKVKDAKPYSGIKTVSYKIFCDDVETAGRTIYDFADTGITNPEYTDLVEEWDTSLLSEENKVVIDALKNNSDNVKIQVTVVDNAGNTNVVDRVLKISAKDPTIELSYEDDPTPKDTNEDVVYYDTNRKAKIVITGRTSIWEDTLPVINITAVNSKGEFVDNTYEISDWITVEKENPNDATHTAYITFKGSAKYHFTVDYTDKANRTAVQVESNTFVVDHNNPTGTITVNNSTWDKLLSKLTFGLWSKESVTVSATTADETSEIKSIEYFKSAADTIVTTEELDNATWTEFKQFSVDKDEQFTVYLKITDYAGHHTYISSDGYIVDMKDSTIEFVTEPANGNGYYNKDVNIDIFVKDAKPYSGIKTVEYWIEKDSVETKRETLYSFEYVRDEGVNSNGGTLKIYDKGVITEETGNVSTKDHLKSDFKDTITVKAVDNNSDDVKVHIKVTDNAGNDDEKVIPLKIDVTAPKIDIQYNTDEANIVDSRGYFKTERVATIKITERDTGFNTENATKGIKITAVDADNNNVELDLDNMISKWGLTEGATPDEAVHTATISYTADANYTFDISYTDNAGNVNETPNTGSHKTPYKFTVDKTNPTATVSIKGKKIENGIEVEDESIWDTFLSVITFGLWKNDKATVSATHDDETSDTTIKYYKANSTNGLNYSQIKELADSDWTDYTKELEIADSERFIVYIKVTDTAGNTIFINSDGYIVDKVKDGNKKTQTQITLTPDGTAKNSIYSGDVGVSIKVEEPTELSDVYSGIKKVEYWVTNNGKETQRETLYSFEYERDKNINGNGGTLKVYEDGKLIVDKTDHTPTYGDLKQSFSKRITVDSEANNSSDVVVYVGVTDNAGNYVQKSVPLDIDITAPEIKVTYDNNVAYKVVNAKNGEHGYFAKERIATVAIKERTNHFNAAKATAGITITAKDVNNNVIIEDCSKLISGWTTNTKEVKTPDDVVHTATISYTADANYTFEIKYADNAGNANVQINTDNSVAPYSFTVDTNKPTGTVTVEKLGTWDELIETLTFGLWSKDTVSVSGTSKDITSPIESVSYYKTADTKARTAKQLKELDEKAWKEFKGFDISANEQFTIYVRIVDFAGNTNYISTNGIIVDNVKPEFELDSEEIKPEITLTPVGDAVNKIYNDDVAVAVKVVDPITGNTYSGLKEIRYQIINMGIKTQEGVLYNFANEIGKNALTQDKLRQIWENKSAIIVDSKLNNSNDVKVKVYAVDNADNANENEITLKIDLVKPTIDITYDNNNGDTKFNDGTYFKANRTATIVITERNFNKDKVKIDVTNTDEDKPTLSGWYTEVAGGSGDGTKHTATLTYSADGDYSFAIAYTDEAGNASEKVNYGSSLAPEKFTIDKTNPTVSISYDNNQALNGNYYKAQRVATIVVNEHNFETSRVKFALKATDNGMVAPSPAVSRWSSNGNVHTATITYSADARYTFDFDYTDKAGNATADIVEQVFYVDKTNPSVSITKIANQSANNSEGKIGFVVTATDTNFDVFTPVLTVTDIKGKKTKLNVGATTDIANGKVYTVENLTADGIYRINCTVVDKAGNAYSEVTLQRPNGTTYVEKVNGEDTLVTFSVNRKGSTYEINDDTATLVDKYYVQNVTDNIVVIETNADALNEYKVILNGKELTKDTDYTVEESGGNGQWMKYTYVVNKELFAEEGEYKLVISSKDKAKNDAFSDVKDTTINFVIDRTPPVVAVSGMATDGRYKTDSQKVTLIPTDDGGAIKSLIVRTVDKDGNVIKELINLSDEALEKALEEGDGKIEFIISKGLYQNVQIICDDRAVNEEGKSNTYDETFTNISVSSSGFMIFWANKPLRWGSIAGVILISVAIIFFIIFKKRKKEEQK